VQVQLKEEKLKQEMNSIQEMNFIK